MISAHEPVIVALDSNVFLSLLLPDATKAGADNVRGCERIIRALAPGQIVGVTTAMTLAEIRWAFARSGQGNHLQVYYTLVTAMSDRLEIMPVTAALAYESGALRAKYYSRSNDLSYADALCLATALERRALVLVSSDPHLLKISDLPVVEPRRVPDATQIASWLRRR